MRRTLTILALVAGPLPAASNPPWLSEAKPEHHAIQRERHQYHEREEDRQDDHRGWDFEHPRHRHLAPDWMNAFWRPGQRRYCALVPGDPSRIYILMGGRWRLRRVEPAVRMDLDGAFALPEATPPLAPPHLKVQLKVVLFD